MDVKKLVIPIIEIGVTITSALFLKGNSNMASNVIKETAEVLKKSEKIFGSIPLSKLNEVAKGIYHGIKVTVDQYGFLVFHYTSKSGKTIFHEQIHIDELGKLVNLGRHHPGQWWSSADEFVKRANELFLFKR